MPFALALSGSCDKIKSSEPESGTIRIAFNEEALTQTRSGASALDTNKFILTVTNESGEALYSGLYGDAPEEIVVDPGTYSISAISCKFEEPVFEKPQYGDSQIAVVASGEACAVRLACAQMNAGIKLNIKETFLVTYPDALLYLKSASGSIAYAYDETRIAYFKPGTVSLVMRNGSETTTLLTRTLTAQQILTINVNAGYTTASTSEYPEGITMSLDTSRNWISETFIYNGEDSGSSSGSEISGAYSVGQARSIAENGGEKGAWVYGYIVGGDCTSSSCSFTAPFSSATHLVIAAKTSCVDKSSCVSVELAKGDIRNALNLVDHADYIGRQVFIKGNIVQAYYGIPGVKGLTEYYLN